MVMMKTEEEEEVPGVPEEVPAPAPRGAEALVEWRAIVTLLCTGEAAAVCSGHAVPAVPASVRSAFARQPGGAITAVTAITAAEGVEGCGALGPEVEVSCTELTLTLTLTLALTLTLTLTLTLKP